jgi:hypothetical protein
MLAPDPVIPMIEIIARLGAQFREAGVNGQSLPV